MWLHEQMFLDIIKVDAWKNLLTDCIKGEKYGTNKGI